MIVTTMTVWWCSTCREDVQIGARPTHCPECGPQCGGDLRSIEVPYVSPVAERYQQ